MSLGVAATVCIDQELEFHSGNDLFYLAAVTLTPQELRKTDIAGTLRRYAARRENRAPESLPDLPVPLEFRQALRDWAKERVNFTQAPEG